MAYPHPLARLERDGDPILVAVLGKQGDRYLVHEIFRYTVSLRRATAPFLADGHDLVRLNQPEDFVVGEEVVYTNINPDDDYAIGACGVVRGIQLNCLAVYMQEHDFIRSLFAYKFSKVGQVEERYGAMRPIQLSLF